MHKGEKDMLLSFLKPYPKGTSLTALAIRMAREGEGRQLFGQKDSADRRLARLKKEKRKVLRLLTKITRDDPRLLMELRLPLQSQSAELYRQWGLKAPLSETYYSLAPRGEEE